MEGQFDKYVNMIRKQAHKYAKQLNVPYEDMEAQGYLIYCECLNNFDVSKGANFGTHLFIELRRLNDFGHTYNRQSGILLEDMDESEYPKFRRIVYKSKIVKESHSQGSLFNKPRYDIEAEKENPKLEDLLETAKESLSMDAYKIIEWIVGRTWEDFSHTKPSITMAMKKFNIGRNKMSILWSECSNFWNNEGKLLYC